MNNPVFLLLFYRNCDIETCGHVESRFIGYSEVNVEAHVSSNRQQEGEPSAIHNLTIFIGYKPRVLLHIDHIRIINHPFTT